MILNNYYQNSPKVFTKIIIQVLVIMIVLDIIWFFVMNFVWGKAVKNAYWESQSFLRTIALFLCWVQIGIKGFLSVYLFLDFKNKNPDSVNYLYNLDYSIKKSDSVNNSSVQKSDDFKNPY
jgi:hypothetical protein